jgi:hypothetical protein
MLLHDKLTVVQLAKKYPHFKIWGPTVFTRARHWAKYVQSITSNPIYIISVLILSSHLRLCSPNVLFPSDLIIIISGSTVLVRNLTSSHWRFRNLIKTRGRTTLDEWSARRKGLYLHRTTQHRNTKTNIHASSGILTHVPINQAAKT